MAMQKTVSQWMDDFYFPFLKKNEVELDKYSSNSMNHNPVLTKLVQEFPPLSIPLSISCATVMEKHSSSIYKIYLDQSFHFIVTSTKCDPFDSISFSIESIFPFYSNAKSDIPLLFQVKNVKPSTLIDSHIHKCNKCNSIALKDELYCKQHKYEKLEHHLSSRMELQGLNYFKTNYETSTEEEKQCKCWYYINQKWTTLSTTPKPMKKRKRTQTVTLITTQTCTPQHRYIQEQQRIEAQEYMRKIVKAKQRRELTPCDTVVVDKIPNMQLFQDSPSIGTVDL